MADTKLTGLTGISVPVLTDLTYVVDVSDTTDDAAGSSRNLTLERAFGLAGVLPGGRLTTESGVGVSTSDRTSQSTLYYTPFNSDYIRLYDGTRVKEYVFTERSLALSGLTSGKNYDVWLYDSSGTLTLELLVWTDDTTRATALAWQSGLGWTKSGDATRFYLGTIRTTATTTTEDSATKRFVWNAYNAVPRDLAKAETTDSWTYSTASWRSANNSTANRVEFVRGLNTHPVSVEYTIHAGSTAAVNVISGLGLDSTSATSAQIAGTGLPSVGTVLHMPATYQGSPSVGYHYLQALEYGGGTGTQTWYGDAGLSGWGSGLYGEVWG